ncbi:MAG: class I tRNA ligase family protein, partial [Candidatus Aenigmatarchaeota archaeon]
KMAEWLEKKGFGKRVVNYKLRDWGISRQRYWGTPIPIVYCDKCGIVPVAEKDLPVLLPDDVQFTGQGNPLASHKPFVDTKCPKCGGKGRRETDTMDTFVDSSWYFLRYCNPEAKGMFDPAAVKYWMPVDQYIGGAEHAVMHLLYARFFVKVLRDLGLLSFDEPFTRLFNQGIVYRDGHKMSKSFGNAVTQEEIAGRYGIDTARVFLLFVASPDSQVEWNDKGIQGAYRFLSRYQGLVLSNGKNMGTGPYKAVKVRDRILQARMSLAVQRMTLQIEDFQLNLAIGTGMEFLSFLQSYAAKEEVNEKLFGEAVRTLIKLMSPFAPHTSEELWEKAKMKGFVSVAPWPQAVKADEKAVEMEAMIERLREDMASVVKLSGMTPKKIRLVVSSKWKYVMMDRLCAQAEKTRNFGEILKALMADPSLRPYGKDVSRMVPALLKNPERMRACALSQEDEVCVLEEISPELSEAFGCAVSIETAEKSDSKKASQAMPGKPGIEVA